MPISSTNSRLTRELYKPPPKSLEQIHREEQASGQNTREGTPSSVLKRERHLDSYTGRRTAVVGPVNDRPPGNSNGLHTNGHAISGIDKSGVPTSAWSGSALNGCCLRGVCCYCHGLICTRCCLLAFLLGLLLGSLIVGLVVGLILDDRNRGALDEATQPLGCFQSPCPSSNATCAYRANNTLIDCNCVPLMGEPISTAGVSAEGYRCTLHNFTSTTVAPVTIAP